MSSKRKSPPSKLPDGSDLPDRMSEAAAVAVAVAAATAPAAAALQAASAPPSASFLLRTGNAISIKEENDSSPAEERISRESSPRSKRKLDDTSAAFAGKMSPAVSETSSAIASGSDEYEDGLSTNEDEGGGGGGGSCSPTHKRRRRTHPVPVAPPGGDSTKLENGFPYSMPYDMNPAAAFGIPPISSLIGSSPSSFLNLNYERMLDSATNAAAAAAMMNHHYSGVTSAALKNHKKLPTSIESSVDKMFNFHLGLNNNSMLYNNNNSSSSNNNHNSSIEHGNVCGTNGRNDAANSNKRSMEDVLKRLTTKMNDNSIKEERRSHSPSSQRT